MPKTKKKKHGTCIPYARGYKPPSVSQSLAAITYPTVSNPDLLPNHLKPTPGVFNPINPPISQDDWLAQYNEDGQTYRQYIQGCPWLGKRKWRKVQHSFNPDGSNIKQRYPEGTIYILKLGHFNEDTHSNGSSITPIRPSFEALVEYVRIFYELPVQILEGIELVEKGREEGEERGKERKEDKGFSIVYTPTDNDENISGKTLKKRTSMRPKTHTLEYRFNRSKSHTQLCSNSILAALAQHVPADAFLVMGLTMFDLYEEQPDLFVAGMAAGNHRVGVFSFFRYNPLFSFSTEFWYEIKQDDKCPTSREEAIVLQRSCKLLVHEIAHLLGVDHCIWYQCCMNGSGHLDEDFRQPMFLCPVDLHKLETLCGFEVIRRYQNMAAFFEKYGLEEEVQWIRNRLKMLK